MPGVVITLLVKYTHSTILCLLIGFSNKVNKTKQNKHLVYSYKAIKRLFDHKCLISNYADRLLMLTFPALLRPQFWEPQGFTGAPLSTRSSNLTKSHGDEQEQRLGQVCGHDIQQEERNEEEKKQLEGKFQAQAEGKLWLFDSSFLGFTN